MFSLFFKVFLNYKATTAFVTGLYSFSKPYVTCLALLGTEQRGILL